MKPYRSIYRAGLLYGLTVVIFLVTSGVAAGAARKPRVKMNLAPIAQLGKDAATRRAYDHFYNMEYDRAIREFELILREHPDSPEAINHLTTAVLFKELYRTGALDTELFASDKFLDSRHFPVDPKVRERIRELNDRSLILCETTRLPLLESSQFTQACFRRWLLDSLTALVAQSYMPRI